MGQASSRSSFFTVTPRRKGGKAYSGGAVIRVIRGTREHATAPYDRRDNRSTHAVCDEIDLVVNAAAAIEKPELHSASAKREPGPRMAYHPYMGQLWPQLTRNYFWYFTLPPETV